MDFAVLPPEVNSGRMYAGAGSAPMMSAAAAWDGLATQLSSAASSYQAVVTELTDGVWRGPASAAMAAAASPYVAWMTTTAGQAEQTANQARAAAAAYEAAFAATVPPPVIAANRTLLASLVANNVFGQNTAAIAANQAEYAEMWAQDAAAMYSYAGSSAAATTLTPFPAAAQNTDPAGASAQATATAQAASTSAQSAMSAVPNTLQTLASAAANPLQPVLNLLTSPPVSALNALLGTFGLPLNILTGAFFAVTGVFLQWFPSALNGAAMVGGASGAAMAAGAVVSDVTAFPEGALGSTLAGSYGPARMGGVEAAAGVGRAGAVGGLSVPPTWGTTPQIRLASITSPAAGVGGVPAIGSGRMGGMPLLGPIGSVVNAPRNGEPRLRAGAGLKAIPAVAKGPGVDGDAPSRLAPPNAATRNGMGTLSERERDELDRLRERIAELAVERDAMARLMGEAMRP